MGNSICKFNGLLKLVVYDSIISKHLKLNEIKDENIIKILFNNYDQNNSKKSSLPIEKDKKIKISSKIIPPPPHQVYLLYIVDRKQKI